MDLATVFFCLALVFAGFLPGWLFGTDHGEARANRYHVDQKIRAHEAPPFRDDRWIDRDVERAYQLFLTRWETLPDGSHTAPAVREDAIELLKSDPEEFFRLNRMWMETQQ